MTPHPGGKKDLLPTTTEDQDCNEVNPGYCFLGGKCKKVNIAYCLLGGKCNKVLCRLVNYKKNKVNLGYCFPGGKWMKMTPIISYY